MPIAIHCRWEGPDAEELKQVTRRIENLLQLESRIVTGAVKMLPPLPSGKFRLTHQVKI